MKYNPEGPESLRAHHPEETSEAKQLTKLYDRIENVKAELEHLGTMNLYPLEYEHREAKLQSELKNLRDAVSRIEGH